jgi:predicted ester cyclase
MAQQDTLLHRWFEEVWNQGREDAIDELLAADAVVHGMVAPGGGDIVGPAGFKPHYQALRATLGDISVTIEDVLIDGDRIAVRCNVSALHSGAGLGTTPTQRRITLTGMCIARVADGKIVEGWNNFDFLALYQQLGIPLS